MKAPPISIAVWEKFLRLRSLNDPMLEELVRCCARFCRRFKQGDAASWLTLMGTTGTGKTHCAQRIWEWSRRRVSWRRVNFIESEIYWPEMVGRLRDPQDREAKQKLRELAGWPVLFLDDVGAERDITGFAAEQLNALLGQREQRWTIITTNLGLEQLAGIDPRISDRIIRGQGNEYVEINTMSYALRIKARPEIERYRSSLPPGDRD
jgi:DNA replication protein DnaC